MMIPNNELVLKPINDLLEQSFFIPSYQRGYRWTNRQVTELLDDVYEFCSRRKNTDDEFYCLQPIVVKAKGEQWELVDGQQRLTTILLILGYFNLRLSEDFRRQLYSIEYETRPGSEEYLLSLNEEQKDQNIDFFHMFESYNQIKIWFKDKMNRINDIESAFLNDVKVIWYQVNEDINATAVFTRLNIGKISLTNAELVKALFLKSGNFDSSVRFHTQLKMAQEWDEIERMLQNDEFWFFANNQNKEANRIEFILDLVANQLPNYEDISRRDPFHIFLTFHHHLALNKIPIEDEWYSVKQYFMTLREWFEDRGLFHLVGLLVLSGESVGALMELYNKCSTKQEFRRNLIKLEFSKLFPTLNKLDEYNDLALLQVDIKECLDDLSYDSSNSQIKHTLVLFNIASLLANPSTNARFQFSKFKLELWDIEHIRSVTSQMPESKERQKIWLEGVVDYLSVVKVEDNSGDNDAEQIISGSKNILEANTFDSDAFEKMYNRVLELYDPEGDEETDNSLGNLTLLDRSTNRSYQNAIFPIKRRRIIRLDKLATFVPLCTKNVFLKYYSNQVNNMLFWEPCDSEDHFEAIAEMLITFFTNKEVV